MIYKEKPKEPKVVDAMQFTTNNEENGSPEMDKIVNWCNQGQSIMQAWHNGTTINLMPNLSTNDSNYIAYVGDYIVRSSTGYFTIVKKEEFESRFELID